MKTLNKILAFSFLVFSYLSISSQNIKPILENEKQIVFKIASYSVDTDKLVQKEFSKDNDLKIVYTCIPTGILVFESKSSLASNQKENIEVRLKKVYEAIQFIHMQGFTLKEAEEKCASKRTIN